MPRDTGVAWRHLRSIMTRCARGRGRESPKKAVKRKKEGKRKKKRGLARISRNISTIGATTPVVSSLSPSRDLVFGPVASPLALTTSRLLSREIRVTLFRPAVRKTKFCGSSLYAEFLEVIQENPVFSLEMFIFRVLGTLRLRLWWLFELWLNSPQSRISKNRNVVA